MVGRHQPVTLAAMEGRFVGGSLAGVAVIGQPNVAARQLENPIEIPGALSFLAYGTFQSYVQGLEEYPEDVWPDKSPLARAPAPRVRLVAGGFLARDRLLRLYLATLCGKSKRQAGHPRFLLMKRRTER